MSRPFTSTSRRSLAVGAVLVGLAAIVLLVPVLELWDVDPSVPIASVYEPANDYVYAPDAPFYLMLAKGGIDHAWFLTNPTLGWPLGQQVYDLPQTLDNLNLVEIKVLGLVFGDAGTTINVFFVLTFAMVAVSAFLVLRRLRVSAPTSFVVALLYTFLPYHFARGAPHVLLSSYWVVPIAVYLVLRVVSTRPPFTADADGAARVPRPPVRPFGHPLAARVRRDRLDRLVLRRLRRGARGDHRAHRRAREPACACGGVGGHRDRPRSRSSRS